MQKFLTSKAKILYIVFFVLTFALLVSAVVYATQYANIHVLFTAIDGDRYVTSDSQNEFKEIQTYVFDFFKNTTDPTFEKDFGVYVPTVIKFQETLAAVNDFIVAAGVVSIICVAGLFILSNHNRKVYYKSNLVGGIVLPLVVIIMNVILIVKNLSLMSFFNENYELFNRVSVLQTRGQTKIDASQSVDNIQFLKDLYSCDSTTFIIYTIFCCVIIAYALFMMFYSVYRYKECAERRNQIMERAVNNND